MTEDLRLAQRFTSGLPNKPLQTDLVAAEASSWSCRPGLAAPRPLNGKAFARQAVRPPCRVPTK
jgi:hypothetical protein